jgi:hypothetical protein
MRRERGIAGEAPFIFRVYRSHRGVSCGIPGGEPVVGIDEALNSAISAFGIDAALDSGSVFSLNSLWETIGR